MLQNLNSVLTSINDFIWGAPLMILILAGGIYLTSRLGLLQLRRLPLLWGRLSKEHFSRQR